MKITVCFFLIVNAFIHGVFAQNIIAATQNSVIEEIPLFFPISKQESYRLSSKYGNRRHPIHKRIHFHTGIDLAVRKGASVHAAANGKVIRMGYAKGLGNFVEIQHKGNLSTIYGHMSKRMVKRNQNVKQGQIIGLVGSTGVSTGPHLHFELKRNQKSIDPLKYWDIYINAYKKGTKIVSK